MIQDVLATVNNLTLCTGAGHKADLLRQQNKQEEEAGETRIMGRYTGENRFENIVSVHG